MNLAKPALDIGLYTNQLEPMLAFWQDDAHVGFSELLPLGGGVHQHRHAIGQSILKVNHPREPIDPGTPTGLQALTIFDRSISKSITLKDPDGNHLNLLPAAGERNLKLHLTTPNLAAQQEFYGEILKLPYESDHVFVAGASRIELIEGDLAPFERSGIGYRYMTFQVFDIVNEHTNILQMGGREGMAPIRLGEVAYISFVQDADQNWIEISQRKSITGSLD